MCLYQTIFLLLRTQKPSCCVSKTKPKRNLSPEGCRDADLPGTPLSPGDAGGPGALSSPPELALSTLSVSSSTGAQHVVPLSLHRSEELPPTEGQDCENLFVGTLALKKS